MRDKNKKKTQLIVALDVDTLKQAKTLVDMLAPVVDVFKVGSQLFTACGPSAVRFIHARGKKVFLDLKFHDIPNTVAGAVRTAVALGGPILEETEVTNEDALPRGHFSGLFMYTLHILGGKAMMKAALEAGIQKAIELSLPRPLVVGITVLTSEGKIDNIPAIVLERAHLAKEAGLDGVVASVHEAKLIRQRLGEDFIIVTPGIRLQGTLQDDQQRIATPTEAVINGSHYIVVGRPIIQSEKPLETTQKILEEINRSS